MIFSSRNPLHRPVRGFTLVELMIAVVIIGILAAIAIPSYTSYVKKSNRAVAQAFIQTVANREEQIFPDQRSYQTAANNNDLTVAPFSLSLPREIVKYYTVTVASASARVYTITATPVVGTMQAGDGNLTLDNTGAKTGNW